MIHGVVLFSAFLIVWFLALFCLLPVGLGAELDSETGAPLTPRLGLKAMIAAAIAAAVWVVFYALVLLKIVDL